MAQNVSFMKVVIAIIIANKYHSSVPQNTQTHAHMHKPQGGQMSRARQPPPSPPPPPFSHPNSSGCGGDFASTSCINNTQTHRPARALTKRPPPKVGTNLVVAAKRSAAALAASSVMDTSGCGRSSCISRKKQSKHAKAIAPPVGV